jgi:hypothetical protein
VKGVLDLVADHYDPPINPHVDDPGLWVKERTGGHFWSKQNEIGKSVVENRYTVVHSAHSTGKSFTASRLVAWWLETREDAFVVTTAPSSAQIGAILWREIHAMHEEASLAGRTTLDNEWYLGRKLVAFGRKPADYIDPEKAKAQFQGIHAMSVLVILDEAAGIPAWLWEAVDSLMTNEDCRALAIGNPDDPASEFAKVCNPGSIWNRIHISAYDTPVYTGEPVPERLLKVLVSKQWVNERKKKWGEDSPMYTARVLGLFPELTDDTLIQPSWIQEAIQRDLPGFDLGTYGADVARKGADLCAVYHNRGGVLRVAKLPAGTQKNGKPKYRRAVWGKKDTMKTAGLFKKILDVTKGAVPMVIDVIGIGAGVYDRLREQELPVYAFNSSEKALGNLADTEDYRNRRSQQWWYFRKAFEMGMIDLDPDDIDLHAQLISIKWWTDSRGKINVEPKELTVKRLGVSPDLADAAMMSTVQVDAWREFVRDHMGELESGETLTGDLLDKAM